MGRDRTSSQLRIYPIQTAVIPKEIYGSGSEGNSLLLLGRLGVYAGSQFFDPVFLGYYDLTGSQVYLTTDCATTGKLLVPTVPRARPHSPV